MCSSALSFTLGRTAAEHSRRDAQGRAGTRRDAQSKTHAVSRRDHSRFFQNEHVQYSTETIGGAAEHVLLVLECECVNVCGECASVC